MLPTEPLPTPVRSPRWRRVAKIVGNLLATIVLLWMLAAGWELYQFSKDPENYLVNRYGRGLGKVTSAEVLSLGPEASTELAARFPRLPTYRRRPWSENTYLVHRRAEVKGIVAQQLADLWRRQEYIPHAQAGCHEPGYVIRFYIGPWKRLEVTLCWQCDNIAFPLLGTEEWNTFDAHGTNGAALLSALQTVAPTFNYTNDVVSASEVVSRVDAVLQEKEPKWDSVEWVEHSPQRREFVAEIGRRLPKLSINEKAVAVQLVMDLKLTNEAPAVERLLAHTNRKVRGVALTTLQSLRVPVNPEALSPLLISEDESERQNALLVAVRRTEVEPTVYLPAIERSLAVYGRQAFSPNTRESLRKLTNRWPAWSPIYDRLRRGTNAPPR
jgi:hypothetical protein